MSDDNQISKEQRRAQRHLDQVTARADRLRAPNMLKDQYSLAGKYKRTPEDIVDLVQTWSHANEDETYDDVHLLVSLFEEDAPESFTAGGDGGGRASMTPEKVKLYMVLLDRIFFFNVLTRQVAIGNKVMEDTELVELRTYHTASFGKSVDWNTSQMRISIRTQTYQLEEPESDEEWADDGDDGGDDDEKLEVYRTWDRDVDEILCDLLEAMCLAFLDLFCSHDSVQYHDEIMPGKGFGQGWRYWELVAFVMERMADWLPDSLNEIFTKRANDAMGRGMAIFELVAKLKTKERRFLEDFDDIEDETYIAQDSGDDD